MYSVIYNVHTRLIGRNVQLHVSIDNRVIAKMISMTT